MTDPDPWDFSRPSAGVPAAGAPFASATAPASPAFGDWSDPDPATDPYGFGPDTTTSAPSSSSSSSHVGPPNVWLVAATVAALLGLAVAAPSLRGGTVYIAGWALAGPLAIGLLAVFARLDAARQTAVLYSYPAWKAGAYRAILVLCFAAVICDALRIADWAGHR